MTDSWSSYQKHVIYRIWLDLEIKACWQTADVWWLEGCSIRLTQLQSVRMRVRFWSGSNNCDYTWLTLSNFNENFKTNQSSHLITFRLQSTNLTTQRLTSLTQQPDQPFGSDPAHSVHSCTRRQGCWQPSSVWVTPLEIFKDTWGQNQLFFTRSRSVSSKPPCFLNPTEQKHQIHPEQAAARTRIQL